MGFHLSQVARYYVTHQTELYGPPISDYALSIWKYDLGSAENRQIGNFKWNPQTAQGSFEVRDSQTDAEVLQLSNCIITE